MGREVGGACWRVSQRRETDHTETNSLPASLGPPGLRGRSPAQRLPCGPVTCGRYAKLDLEKRTRDLALFNLAIDSKLRGRDLVALRVDDVAPKGYAIDRANFSQRKSGAAQVLGSGGRCGASHSRPPGRHGSRRRGEPTQHDGAAPVETDEV